MSGTVRVMVYATGAEAHDTPIRSHTRERTAPRTHARVAALRRRPVSQHRPGRPGAQEGLGRADVARVPPRRAAAHAAGAAPVGESAGELVRAARDGFARDVARALDRTPRDRRRAHPDRPGVGRTGLAGEFRRPQAISAG